MRFKSIQVDTDLRADFIVENKVIVELRAVDAILPIHRAQILTYMQLTSCNVGLLINFNTEQLVKGVERFIL